MFVYVPSSYTTIYHLYTSKGSPVYYSAVLVGFQWTIIGMVMVLVVFPVCVALKVAPW